MKGARIFLYFAASIYFGFALNVPLRAQAGSRGSTAPFASFVGRWHCDGKFARNGKPISANLVFESILRGRFILFRHDDELPFNYHAWSEWGWDANRRQFISTIQDISGGVRLFRSPGWVEGTLTWSGGDLPDSSDQRFVFERLGDRKFRVSYFQKNEDSWQAVDSSSCSRVGAN
jgi:hypothetical protein